jgi:hypothetical protein
VSRGELLATVALNCEETSTEYCCTLGAMLAGTVHAKAPAAALTPCVMLSRTVPPSIRARLTVEEARVPVQAQSSVTVEPRNTTAPRVLGESSVTVPGGTKGTMVSTGDLATVLASEVDVTTTV